MYILISKSSTITVKLSKHCLSSHLKLIAIRPYTVVVPIYITLITVFTFYEHVTKLILQAGRDENTLQ